MLGALTLISLVILESINLKALKGLTEEIPGPFDKHLLITIDILYHVTPGLNSGSSVPCVGVLIGVSRRLLISSL